MSIRRQFFLSQFIAASSTAILLTAFSPTTTGLIVSITAAAVIAAGTTWYWNRRLKHGLDIIERVVITGEVADHATDLSDFVRHLGTHIQRWEDMAGTAREQTREIEAVLGGLDRRGTPRGSLRNPAHQLRLLLASVGTNAGNVLKHLISSYSDIDRLDSQTSEVAKRQLDTAARALVEVDVIAQSAEEVMAMNDRARTVTEDVSEVTSAVVETLTSFLDASSNDRHPHSAAESKVRLIREHTIELGALVQAINEVAARTDMLALNASIESVRAGEHGRGFAVVVDEIRKLARSVAKSSDEALERIATVESEIDDATHTIATERDCAQEKLRGIASATRQLSDATHSVSHLPTQFDAVRKASTSQQHRITEVAETLKLVVETAEEEHQRLLDRQWQLRSHADLAGRLTDVLEPLLTASSSHFHTEQRDHAPDERMRDPQPPSERSTKDPMLVG